MAARMEVKRKKRIFNAEDIPLYLMALPTIIFLIIFCYIPMGGLVMAFQELNITKGIFGSRFIGFKNFEFLFASTDAWVITRNTVCYNLAFIVVNMLISVFMAVILSELRTRKYAKVMQTTYMLPYFLSWAVVAIVLSAFVHRDYGLINKLMGAKTDWYKQKSIWPLLLVGLNAWKGAGYQTVLYLAVISGIPVDYYEAAVLDGANKRQQVFHITLPNLRFIIGISLIMAMGSIFRGDFGLFYVVTKDSGRLYAVTDIIDTYIYRGLTKLSNVGMSTAAGMYQSVVGLIMVLFSNWVVTKIDPDSAMF